MPSFCQPIHERARTKIVATVGPACSTTEQLGRLIAAGVDVFRLNMAHGDHASHAAVLENIRAAGELQDRPIGILADLSGPKIRLGELAKDPLECRTGGVFEFVPGTESAKENQLTTNYDLLIDELAEGDRVMLADGTVELRVTKKEHRRVETIVVTPGILRSRQGVNLPGVKLSVPAITTKDRNDAVWAAKHGVDFVSLSFVRAATEIRELQEMLRELGSQALTIAKIEKPEALDNLEDIVAASGGIMVARGDLGVEIDVAETPVAQKRIIDTCTKFRRPVIVATQMLDSMQRSSRPTRAEASDVANAILDGADACMLSGETAIGEYPCESVEMMNRIMLSTEKLLLERPPKHIAPDAANSAGVHPVTEAVVFGAGRIAEWLQAKVVVIETRSGRTALAKSKQRDFISTVGVSANEETLRMMALFWGIEPVRGAPLTEPELRAFVDQWGKGQKILKSGDLVVLLASGDFRTNAHNHVLVHEVK